jgi:hypothetical protein
VAAQPHGNTQRSRDANNRSRLKADHCHPPRPHDQKERIVDNVEWHRVAYRIDAPPAPSFDGILALGALTTNLFQLSLARPSGDLMPGKPLAVRAFAGNPVTRHAMRGVRITAQLELDVPGTKESQKLIRTAIADRSGAAGAHFTFRFTPRFAIQAKAAPSILLDYYNPDERVVLAPQSFAVSSGSR